MSLFGLGRHRAEEEALRERVSALQTARDHWRAAAKWWTEVRLGITAGVAVVFLVLGFVLGVYREPILRIAGLDSKLGTAPPGPETVIQKLDVPPDTQAQLTLAYLYYGGHQAPQDYREAAKWFRLAAERGNPAAQFYLGLMHAKGQGVPQDRVEAANWYRRAADGGNPEAQYNLGLAYANGEGVPQDNVSAHMCFNLASNGFAASDSDKRSSAIRNRDVVAAKMTPEQIAEAERQAREWHPRS
jgi:TPR repeat protein